VDALFLLIPLSVLALGVAAWLFLRMNSDGQFDEGDGPAWRVLMDDDSPQKEHKEP
jgi:cbb3-type cytochrome oxidase maturation protein